MKVNCLAKENEPLMELEHTTEQLRVSLDEQSHPCISVYVGMCKSVLRM